MLEALLGIASASILALAGFTYSASSRIAVLEAKDDDLKELINEKFNSVNQRLDRIERAMNGALKGH